MRTFPTEKQLTAKTQRTPRKTKINHEFNRKDAKDAKKDLKQNDPTA
jgi:hypothetical protein